MPTSNLFPPSGSSRIYELQAAISSLSSGEVLYYPRPNNLGEVFELQALLSLERFAKVGTIIIDTSLSDSTRYLTNLFYLNQIRKLASTGKVSFKHQTAKVLPIHLSIVPFGGFPEEAISNGKEYILKAVWDDKGSQRVVTIFVLDLFDFNNLIPNRDDYDRLAKQIFDYAFIAIDGLDRTKGTEFWRVLREIEGFIIKADLRGKFNSESCDLLKKFEWLEISYNSSNTFKNEVYSKYVLRWRKEPRKRRVQDSPAFDNTLFDMSEPALPLNFQTTIDKVPGNVALVKQVLQAHYQTFDEHLQELQSEYPYVVNRLAHKMTIHLSSIGNFMEGMQVKTSEPNAAPLFSATVVMIAIRHIDELWGIYKNEFKPEEPFSKIDEFLQITGAPMVWMLQQNMDRYKEMNDFWEHNNEHPLIEELSQRLVSKYPSNKAEFDEILERCSFEAKVHDQLDFIKNLFFHY